MRHEFSDEYHESVRLMIGFVVVFSIMFSVVLCTCGPCIIFAMRRAWTSADMIEKKRNRKPVDFTSLADVLEEKDREACVHCHPKAQEPKPQPPKPKEPVISWLDFALFTMMVGALWCIAYPYFGGVPRDDPPLRLFFKLSGDMLAASLAGIAVGLYLRCVPAVILQLRRKPNGARYQPIVEAIVKEDQRRRGIPRDTYFDNNGFDEKTQMAIFALAGLISVISNAFLVIVPVACVSDYFGGKLFLKMLIKSYVKYYYNPEQMPNLNASVVDELMFYSKVVTKPAKEQGWVDDVELSNYNGPVETPESKEVDPQGKSDQAMDVDSVRVDKSSEIIHADHCNCFNCRISNAFSDDDEVPPCDF